MCSLVFVSDCDVYSAYGLDDYAIRVREKDEYTGRIKTEDLNESEFSEEAVSATNQMLVSSTFCVVGSMVGLASLPNTVCPDNPLLALTYPARQLTIVVGRGARKCFD